MYIEDRSRQTLGQGQATKPLPQLPRGWSRVRHETGLFLRSIGLGIVVTFFQDFFTKSFSEPEKVAIRQSRVTALLRSLIHALPLGVAIFEIFLNWKGHYIGKHFDKQNYLQFVAKLHEILMQASIATVIQSFTRYQTSAGRGMPFGAVLGALQFLQISYIWSAEFWSAIMSKEFQWKKKMYFVGLVLVCATVAATAGPSSANLLIARQGLWPEKSAYLSVNTTFQNIWPDRLDHENSSRDCKVVRLTSAENKPRCPLSNLYTFFEEGPVRSVLNLADGGVEFFTTQNPGTNYTSELMIASSFGESKTQVCATHSQQVLLGGLVADSWSQYQAGRNTGNTLESYHSIEDNCYQPYTVANCVADKVLNGFDQAPLRFARISVTDEIDKDQDIVSVPALTKSESIDKIPGDRSQFRVGWVDLPQEIFSTRVPGAIIVHPQNSSDSSYNITTCTLNAGWGSSTILTDSISPTDVRSHVSHTPPSWPITTFNLDAYGYLSSSAPYFGNSSDFSYPQRQISISKNWMERLNPTFILFDNSTIDAFSLFLSTIPSQPSETDAAVAMNILLVAALSANGAEHDTTSTCK